LPTWALLDGADNFVAFGQYYLRVGRCHLARLAVAPGVRGRGFGERLIRELRARGGTELGVRSFSLFVMAGNAPALRLYRRLGFTEVDYPEPLPPSEKMLYMVASDESSDSSCR
ncbi:MAG TPA: N-acetyltransferase, partial [Steroidobacteraceae bacterium]|nr:N-acetyltransferase [Steroidobacteraceae bacterium]